MLSNSAMSTYAITTVTYLRRPLFLKTANAESLVNMLFHYRDEGRYLLHGFAVMPEHLHVLLIPAAGQTIERCAQCIKGGFSHQIRTNFRGEIWQAGFHDHLVKPIDLDRLTQVLASLWPEPPLRPEGPVAAPLTQ